MTREQQRQRDQSRVPTAAAERAWAAMSVRYAQAAHRLVESDHMIYRSVFDHSGNLLGTIRRLRIDRRSGHVEQVVVLTHGHFGFGRCEIELPWDVLGYDTTLAGYRLALSVSGSAPERS
jgi:sporulation protein YlmC with PRC-barrel domain